MAGRIRQADVDEVKARTDIADIIGERVALKTAGVGAMKGLCPFHDERSPSFNVRPQAGFYHCFGCGESGDVYSFLRKMDHLSFTEAVVRLAWRGVKPINLDAPVRYLSAEEGGVSHFRYGRDNLLLTWMHTRLMVEFVCRLPLLMWRRLSRRPPFQP